MNYMALIKLLVLIDREALLRYGRTVTGDKMMAMKKGLVLSRVLDFVSQKKQEKPTSYWHNFIPRPGPYVYTVKYSGVSDVSALSEAEMALMGEIYAKYRDKTEWELVEVVHQLPEWKELSPEGTSIEVHFERIMQLAKKSDDEICGVAREAAIDRDMELVLSQVKGETR